MKSRHSSPARLALLTAGIILASGGAVLAQTPPQALRLKEVKDLDALDPNWIMGICNLPGLTCNKVEEPRLFERKTEAGSEYYALTEGLMLARLAMKASGQWELLSGWNFGNYPFAPREDGSEQPTMLDIHPALYPAGPDRWAVAVLTNRNEAYSGGGAQFTSADFVALDPEVTQVDEKQRLYGAVPFSCSKMVRACFTPKEHKTSPHCHDETSGYLTLKYAQPASGASYDWTATWHQTSWPAGVPKSAQTKTQTTAVLTRGNPAVAPDTFAFCEGGGADQ